MVAGIRAAIRPCEALDAYECPDGIVKEADRGRNVRKRPLRLDKSVVVGMDDLAIDEVEYFATAVVDAVDAWSAGIAETL